MSQPRAWIRGGLPAPSNGLCMAGTVRRTARRANVEPAGEYARPQCPAAGDVSRAGSATTNREPAYPLGSRNTRPPIASMSRRAANSPMPDPRDRPAAPTRTNGSNTLSQSSTGTPGPSSVT